MKSLLDDVQWQYNDIYKLNGEEMPHCKVPCELMARDDISVMAKSLFAYMTSKPSGYQFSSKRIARDFKEGYRAILSGIKELEESRYLIKKRESNGRMTYVLQENWWSLTVDEAKEALLENFPQAFVPAVVQYERVTFEDARDAIMEVNGNGMHAGRLATDYINTCVDGGLSANENTLRSWVNHVKSGAIK